MAKEMGLNPRSLIKNIPSTNQKWKAPVEEWIRDIYENRRKQFPKRGFGRLRYSVLKKAVSDFKKISRSPVFLAELMMTYVENGVEFTDTYGDIDEKFYNNIADIYQKTIDYILENNLGDVFEKRLRKVVAMSSDIGWGFGDFLQDYYYQHFDLEMDK